MKKAIVHGMLALLLITFAAVQYNDPDPWGWVVMYSIAALVPLCALLKLPTVQKVVFPLALLGCSVGLLASAPGFWDYLTQHFGETLFQEMSAARMYIEETREFGGTLIALLALLYYVVPRWHRVPANTVTS